MATTTSTTMPVVGSGRAERAPNGQIRLTFPLQGPVHTNRTMWLHLTWDEAQALIRELSAIQRIPSDTPEQGGPPDADA